MRRVSRWTALAAATIGIAAFAVNPAAAITFQIDPATTSVSLSNQTGGGIPCFFSSCQVQAAIAPGLPTAPFNVDVGTPYALDFIRWTATGTTGLSSRHFDVTASLGFLAPSGAGTTTGGGSGFGFLLFGVILDGSLTWASGVPNTITLADGSVIEIDFQGGKSIILNNSITTQAYITVESLGPEGGPAVATPLPAALPLFVSGLGALGLFGWRRKRKTQAKAA